ncbi:MAG TPA: response regulator transcription factor [Puia sp.]|uniref:response regulator transcription factor n=1 Tax=Puia sp. TaxID=2045100 RepID=UPI002C4E30C4|nr:response regulator transcription factor [Puia sp.]HVU93663.1 response regulator transcription factor [Puia sp.]
MKLLVIEDEPSLMASITRYFRKEQFLCEEATTFNDALQKIEDFRYDCIILDINLPGGSGLKLLKFLREDKKRDGVIIISARDSLDDKITGLDYGADDYLTKPFHLPELSARVKSLLRRKYNEGGATVDLDGLHIDLTARTVSAEGQPILLSKLEYDLLLFLVTNKNRVVSQQAIAEHLYDGPSDQAPGPEFVYSHIKNLKRKLKEKGAGEIIQTVYKLGYKLVV